MRLKFLMSGFFLVLCLITVPNVTAQNPSVEWLNWDAEITTRSNSTTLEIVETQTVRVTNGTLQTGQRNYSQPVNIQGVYLTVNNERQEQLSQRGGNSSYQVTQANGDIILEYQLPYQITTGDEFTLQINYTVESSTDGLINWFVVPGSHEGPVRSSMVTINFPAGQAPDSDFVQSSQTMGTITNSGNSIIIQSQGTIPANESFEIQLPYSANAANAGNSNNPDPIESSPNGTTTNDTGIGWNQVLLVLCIVGGLIIFGVFSLFRGLLGGLGTLFGGNRSSTPVGTNNPNNQGSPQGGGSSFGKPSTSDRGFRESTNQNRELPPIKTDKNTGGGSTFK